MTTTRVKLIKPFGAAFLALAIVSTVPAAPISENDAANLLFTKQEEKIARDVYLTLGQIWADTSVQIFDNIAVSEQQHMDAVDGLLNYYGLSDLDTTRDYEVGEFDDGLFQDLYDSLILQGSESLEAALYVGVFIEEMDIADLTEVIEETKERRIKRVIGNLRDGSYNHLAAFNEALAALE